MGNTKKLAVSVAAAAVLALGGLSACGQQQATNTISKEKAYQLAEGAPSPDDVRKAALSFSLDGKQYQLWNVTVGELIDQMTTPDQQLDVYISELEYSSDVYGMSPIETSDNANANVNVSSELEGEADISRTVKVSEVSGINVPAQKAVSLSIYDEENDSPFFITAANESLSDRPLRDCVVFLLAIEFDTELKAPAFEYAGIGADKDAAAVLTTLGCPYDEAYYSSGSTFTYELPNGNVEFSFSEEGKMDRLEVTSAWAEHGAETIADEDAEFYKRLRESQTFDWANAEVLFDGRKILLGETKARELASLAGNVSEDMERVAQDMDTFNFGDKNGSYIVNVERTTEGAKLGDCPITAIYYDSGVSYADSNNDGTEPAPAEPVVGEHVFSVGNLNSNSVREDLLTTTGRPSERTGDWYSYSNVQELPGQSEENPLFLTSGLELSFAGGPEGKLSSMYVSRFIG